MQTTRGFSPYFTVMQTISPLAQLGPPPFPFKPVSDPLRAPAFSSVFRLLAVLIVLGCTYGVWSLWSTGQLTATATVASGAPASHAVFGSGLVWALSALALMAYTLWCILTSVTTMTATTLEQTFVWDKKVELRELAYVKLIRVPGLDWLIAPRLYCRTLMGKFAVFYAADAHMIGEFERLRDELSAFRRKGI
jgi:hypothetical protein